MDLCELNIHKSPCYNKSVSLKRVTQLIHSREFTACQIDVEDTFLLMCHSSLNDIYRMTARFLKKAYTPFLSTYAHLETAVVL